MHHCLFIPREKTVPLFEAKNLWKRYGGIFIGIGYVFNELQAQELIKICEDAEIPIYRMPIGEETFEEYVDQHKIDYLRLQMKKNEHSLEKLEQIAAFLKRKEKAQKLFSKTRTESSFDSLLSPLSESLIERQVRAVSPGVSTGFLIGKSPLSIEGGEISVVAAPTGHGKTSFLINLLLGVLKQDKGTKVCFFSYEESLGPLFCLALNHYLDEPLSANNREAILDYFRTGGLEHIQLECRTRFIDKKKRFFEEFIDPGRLNLVYSRYYAEDLVEAIRFLSEKDKPSVVAIDYMQMLRLKDAPKNLSRQEELKKICLLLKDCAQDTGVPLLIAAQFNRTVQAEEELIAQAIGEAGDIERIASLIIGLWNRRYSRQAAQNALYAKVLKARHHPMGGEEIFSFDGNRCKIENVVKRTINDFF